MSPRPQEVVVGGGRVGLALMAMGADLLVRRGEPVPEGEGPIYVATRNDDLPAVLAQTPAARHADLVFLQNGMIEPWLDRHGLGACTRALLYFAVAAPGDAPQDGGGTVASGPLAEVLVRRLARGGVAARAVPLAELRAASVEKLVWNCVFGLMCQVFGEPVGALLAHRRGLVEDLTQELLDQAWSALGLPPDPEALGRVLDYAERIPEHQGAVKEWRWRNGWFVGLGVTPWHGELLARAGLA